MNIGGIQKSLSEILKELSKNEEYDISVFCCKHEGAYFDTVSSNVKIIEKNDYAEISEMSASQCKKKGKKYYLFRLFFSLWSRLFSKKIPSMIFCRLIGKIKGEYDVAISFSQPIEEHVFSKLTNEIVLNCVNARKKVTFLHCDFSSYGGNTQRNRELYEKFDCIAAVSDSAGNKFKEVMPHLAEKVHTVYNLCDCDEVLRLADESPVEYSRKSIVTVARLSEEKGLIRCIPAFAKLMSQGYDFEWHIIGDGPLKNLLVENINKYNLNDKVFLEGEQINPYRFMKNADYFLLPSFHEAAPMVYDEALTLRLPVLTTRTLSADELVGNRKTGIVCDNNEEAIYKMLESALSEKIELNNTAIPYNAKAIEQFQNLCK